MARASAHLLALAAKPARLAKVVYRAAYPVVYPEILAALAPETLALAAPDSVAPVLSADQQD
jgi:hypothetical protein